MNRKWEGDWARVDALFEEALELPSEARDAYLERECGSDLALRKRVETLLEAEVRLGGFLEEEGPEISGEVVARITSSQSPFGELHPGDRLGPYRILDTLGRGGMSAVYRAERADGAFEKTVALKILRSDLPPSSMASRLEQERQILASLSHPNVGRILDGGVTQEGRPYLIMDLVDGPTIHRYAQEQDLSLRQRLELFLQVAQAVQFAHQNLVIHRDLKPSNILVNQQGQAILLDFGIAKILEKDPPPQAAEAHTRVMTPEYAAPEQLQGKPVTTATDIHALGVILYELLTGQRPFGDPSSTEYEVARAICEEDPLPPSSLETGSSQVHPSASGPQGARGVPGLGKDLDAIILKALRKVPDHRYHSVEAFERDIQLYLEGRPVEAREGANFYRFRKFARRHRFAMTAAAIAFLSFLGGGLALARAASIAATERDRAAEAAAAALREAEDSRAVIGFLAEVFKGRNPNQAPGDTLTARELLAWGEDRVLGEFQDNPVLKTELITVLGQAWENLGLLERGQTLHLRSLDLRKEVYGEIHPRVAEGMVFLGANLRTQRDFPGALPFYDDAVEIYRAAGDTTSAAFATALTGLAMALRDTNEADSAALVLEQALRIRTGVDGEESLEYLRTQLDLAYILRGNGDLQGARSLYEEAIPRFRNQVSVDDPDLALHLNNLAFILRHQEEYDGAAKLYQEALASLTMALGRAHPTSLTVAANLAGTLMFAHRKEAADSVLAASVSAARAQWPQGHWRLGAALRSLGVARLRAGNLPQAQDPLQEAVSMYREQLGPEHFWTTMAEGDLAVLLLHRDGSEEGRRALDLLHQRLVGWWEEGNGSLRPDVEGQVLPFVLTLEAVGLSGEAERFRDLLQS